MNKSSIKLLCACLAMPFASHAMLRSVVGKMPLARMSLPNVAARSMATLSDAQRKLLEDRLKNLQDNWDTENASARWHSAQVSKLGVVSYTGECVLLAACLKRRLAIENQIFEIKFKLTKDKK